MTFRRSSESTGFAGFGAGRVLAAALVVSAAARPDPLAAHENESPSMRLLGDTEKEALLLEGEVVRDRPIPEGITHPRRVTLRRGPLEHDAKAQTHDEYKSQLRLEGGLEIDFRDSWRHNVAAYRLDRLLGLGFVPVTVVRTYRQQPAAWTWWVDDVLMSERDRLEGDTKPPRPLEWIYQIHVVRVFDQLIHNFDRSAENLLIDEDWRVWMIDHTRAFKIFGQLRREESLPPRCEEKLLAALRDLERPALEQAMDGLLSAQQIDGLLARRDRIVHFYDDLIAARGDRSVLYEMPSRVVSQGDPGSEAAPPR